jgi:hypothetical protein
MIVTYLKYYSDILLEEVKKIIALNTGFQDILEIRASMLRPHAYSSGAGSQVSVGEFGLLGCGTNLQQVPGSSTEKG